MWTIWAGFGLLETRAGIRLRRSPASGRTVADDDDEDDSRNVDNLAADGCDACHKGRENFTVALGFVLAGPGMFEDDADESEVAGVDGELELEDSNRPRSLRRCGGPSLGDDGLGDTFSSPGLAGFFALRGRELLVKSPRMARGLTSALDTVLRRSTLRVLLLARVSATGEDRPETGTEREGNFRVRRSNGFFVGICRSSCGSFTDLRRRKNIVDAALMANGQRRQGRGQHERKRDESPVRRGELEHVSEITSCQRSSSTRTRPSLGHMTGRAQFNDAQAWASLAVADRRASRKSASPNESRLATIWLVEILVVHSRRRPGVPAMKTNGWGASVWRCSRQFTMQREGDGRGLSDEMWQWLCDWA